MLPFVAGLKKNFAWILLFLSMALILKVWTTPGYDSFYFDSDLARDLKELSNIQQGKIVWLGPWLAPGLHASSSYYYFLYPALALAGGKVEALLTFNICLGLLAVGLFGFLAIKKYHLPGIIGTLLLGLLPVVTDNILHPGNGYSYLYLILFSLTWLWFGLPLVVASAVAGLAVAFHPAAGFLPIFLFYEWWRRGRSWLAVPVNAIAFLLPLAPLIAFEIITKGYIIRHWLSQPSTNGIGIGLSFHNFYQVSALVGLAPGVLAALLTFTAYLIWRHSSPRLKWWCALTIFLLVSVLFFQNVLWRYLFGLALLTTLVIVVTLIRYRLTTSVLLVMASYLFLQSPLFQPASRSARPISQVEAIADGIASHGLIDRSQKIAVVAAVTPNTEVPQADDYRYLLRTRGYQVLDITEQAQADYLLMVIEVPGFDWAGWSNWEIQSFSDKVVDQVDTIDNTTIVVFKRP